jgi:hypothetical protein
MTGRPPTLFETARAELHEIGIDLTMRPGLWCVNYRGCDDATAYFSDELADAIERGRAMAADAFAGFIARGRRAQEAADKAIAEATGKPVAKMRRQSRRRRMTPKAQRRRLIKQHNGRLRAKALKKPLTKPGNGDAD